MSANQKIIAMNKVELERFIKGRYKEHEQLKEFWELFTNFAEDAVLKDETFLEVQTKYSSKLVQIELSIRSHENDLKRINSKEPRVCKVKRMFAFYMLSNESLWFDGDVQNEKLSELLNKHIENSFKTFEVINNDDLSYGENDKLANDFLANKI